MRTWKLGLFLILSLAVLLLAGCAGGGQTTSGNFKGPQKVYYPDWWQTQSNPEFVYTYGVSTKVSENMSRDAAYADAMLQASQYVESTVQGMVKNYEEEAGVKDPQLLALTSKVVRVVSDTKFTKVQVSKQETLTTEDNRFKTFIQVAIPKETVDRQLVNSIRNEEALYNQFKASQAFQELDKQVEGGNK